VGRASPGYPGCVGGGATAEAAIADAAEALRDVAAHKRDGGFDIPRASTLTEIVASGEIGEGESAVMIPLLVDSGSTLRANVSFDAALLDAAAKERGLTRSAFLASAARGRSWRAPESAWSENKTLIVDCGSAATGEKPCNSISTGSNPAIRKSPSRPSRTI
jgi:hypothetical protein